MTSSERLSNLTKQLIRDFEALEFRLKNYTTNITEEPQNLTSAFFLGEAVETGKMIPKLVECLRIMPPITPPTSLVLRSQYEDMLTVTTRLTNQTFPQLSTLTNTFLTTPEAATKASALLNILALLPQIVLDYGRLKFECFKIKRKMRL